jgi:hypothetical protein
METFSDPLFGFCYMANYYGTHFTDLEALGITASLTNVMFTDLTVLLLLIIPFLLSVTPLYLETSGSSCLFPTCSDLL